MNEETASPKKLSMANTKQELLQAYNTLLKQLKEKREAELRPEKEREEKESKEVVKAVEALSSEGVVPGISNLKIEIGKMLTQISDRLEEEVNNFKNIQKAIEIKEKEVQELYGIEKAAGTLAALIEAHGQKMQEFDSEATAMKEELRSEIAKTRAEWEKEKKEHLGETKERYTEEKKRRDREKEEFEYSFEREQQLAQDEFEYEKTKMEKEIQSKKEQMEQELSEREKAVAEKEKELEELRKRVIDFPKDMESAVSKASKETTERIELAAKNNEELLKRQFDGEKNVLTTRIESLEKTAKVQSDQIARLSQQAEMAYQKVQDIAVKAIEGSSSLKSLSGLEQLIKEQTIRQQKDNKQ